MEPVDYSLLLEDLEEIVALEKGNRDDEAVVRHNQLFQKHMRLYSFVDFIELYKEIRGESQESKEEGKNRREIRKERLRGVIERAVECAKHYCLLIYEIINLHRFKDFLGVNLLLFIKTINTYILFLSIIFMERRRKHACRKY